MFCNFFIPSSKYHPFVFYRQNNALDGLHDDVEELNHRIKGANQRTRKLLG